MKKFLAIVFTVAALTFAPMGQADASRPIPGHPLKDVCHNIAGKQTIVDIANQRYVFKIHTPAKHDCKKGPLL